MCSSTLAGPRVQPGLDVVVEEDHRHAVVEVGRACERGQQRPGRLEIEIRVRGDERTVYAAPTLIVHYVEAHRYRPPEEFIAAVLNAG